MGNRYNFFYFEAEFKKYLTAGKAEASTVKNYLSDLHYFFSWVQSTRHIAELEYSELKDVFSHSLIHVYYEYLTTSTTAENTITRRIATLRKFFLLCIEQQWIKKNPVDEFDKKTKSDERQEIVEAYKKALEEKMLSKSDIDRHINVISELVISSHQL